MVKLIKKQEFEHLFKIQCHSRFISNAIYKCKLLISTEKLEGKGVAKLLPLKKDKISSCMSISKVFVVLSSNLIFIFDVMLSNASNIADFVIWNFSKRCSAFNMAGSQKLYITYFIDFNEYFKTSYSKTVLAF